MICVKLLFKISKNELNIRQHCPQYEYWSLYHSICQQIWKTQQWPYDWKKSVFIPIQKKGNAKECLNYHTSALISHARKIMLKILQARLQQFLNRELPDVQAGFRKGRGGAILRWWRNRTGRPLSPPQIRQKIIWTLSKFHRTASEPWWRTPGTQKGSPFSSKGGRTKYKR